MTDSELKFLAKLFSTICTDTYECVYSINKGDCSAHQLTDVLRAFYSKELKYCPVTGKEKSLECDNCTEEDWYETLKLMESKRND